MRGSQNQLMSGSLHSQMCRTNKNLAAAGPWTGPDSQVKGSPVSITPCSGHTECLVASSSPVSKCPTAQSGSVRCPWAMDSTGAERRRCHGCRRQAGVRLSNWGPAGVQGLTCMAHGYSHSGRCTPDSPFPPGSPCWTPGPVLVCTSPTWRAGDPGQSRSEGVGVELRSAAPTPRASPPGCESNAFPAPTSCYSTLPLGPMPPTTQQPSAKEQ